MKSITYTEIKEEHQTGRNGMVIVIELRETVYKSDLRNISAGFFFFLLEASVMGTSHKQCSHINFKCSFLRMLCKNLQWKKKLYKSKQTRTKNY